MNKLTIHNSNVHTHFIVALALVSIIPMLAFFLSISNMDDLSGGESSTRMIINPWIILCFSFVSVWTGYLILRWHEISMERLVRYFQAVLEGRNPQKVELEAKTKNIEVIENGLNDRVLPASVDDVSRAAEVASLQT